jgi:hypothetical protein
VQISGQDWALMDARVRDLIDRVDGPPRRYLCGYAAASRWLTGTSGERPLREGSAAVSLDEVHRERRLAGDTAFDRPGGQAGIDPDYALGVWRMLAWATGLTDRPPLRLPAT